MNATERLGDPYGDLVGEHESVRQEPRGERNVRNREPATGTLPGRRGCAGEHELLVLQFELAEKEELDYIGQLVRLQPDKREGGRVVGSFDRDARSVRKQRGERDETIPRIPSNFDGMNEEFVSAAYGNGQIFVYDSNQSSFQINCTRNWDNLNLSIDASTSRSDLKCENSPSTPQSIEKIWTKSEQYAHNDIATSRRRTAMLTTHYITLT
ncbi:hypothetical protein K0M31_001805 [Melipona bicolor]|uniref:Uncharacterized protein n=1 Tax=Melipona bicolor TaxID=60889 RepID=A0AA40GG96_9HYME|nr:hypothetical protein K0M31_001805 [Melipona bicolor]